MTDDMSATVPGGSVRRVRSEAEWEALLAEFERWDGTQVSFCESRGVSVKSFQGWRRKRGLTAAATAGRRAASKPGGFVEIATGAGPGWDVELSLGDGVTLRLRRP